MHTGAAHVAFEFFGIFQRFAYQRVWILLLSLELRHEFQAVGEVHLGFFAVYLGHMPGQQFHQPVAFGNRKPFDTCHIFQGHLGGHSAVGNDMGNVVGSVFFSNVL